MNIHSPARSLRVLPLILSMILVLTFAGPAGATWSIVVANLETGEVAIGSATCLPNTDLKKVVGVIVVGMGAGQAQALGDSGQNRTTIANGLKDGLTAQEILDLLKNTDPLLEAHQYGIAELQGGAVTFTGANTWDWTGGVSGQSGSMVYAIQGNVLTGEEVVAAAEAALIQTPGDLAEKLMASMNAAKYYGGDGRCSCSAGEPDGCGSPPRKNAKKEKSWKSAHVSYMVIARMGDQDGVFNPNAGFANGTYYMDLNVSETNPVDPVDELHNLYDEWRDSWRGHGDHLLSEKTIYPKMIRADGKSKAKLYMTLVDLDGHGIRQSGASITVTHDDQSAGATTIGPVTDHGDGTYSAILSSNLTTGTDLFRIVVEDGMGPVTLYPFPTLVVN